jgi:hypothetical protein
MSDQRTCTSRIERWWRGALVAAAGILLAGQPLAGHHSFANFYLEDDMIEVEGTIVEFQYRAPHAWVHIQGEDAFGKPQTYAAEWSNPTRLERDGITKNTLKPGDYVRIWASPNRNPQDNRIHLKRIERPRDKWKWQGGRGRR